MTISIINIGNPAVSAGTIKGALFLAAGLFAYAFGSSKVQAIIGIVAAISTRRIGVIVNYSETNKTPLWQTLLRTISTIGAISNFFAQTTRQTVRKKLKDFLDNDISGECVKALKALGITNKDLLAAFDKTKFIKSAKEALNHATTNFNFVKKTKVLTSATTRTRNGISDFVNGDIGFLVHELSHSASLRNDAGVYNALKGKVIGLPKSNGTTEADYSDALSTFFNNNCKK